MNRIRSQKTIDYIRGTTMSRHNEYLKKILGFNLSLMITLTAIVPNSIAIASASALEGTGLSTEYTEPTPEPTITPETTITQVPTITLEPTVTPTPEPSALPAIPTPTPTPELSQIPEATITPSPALTSTPVPTKSPFRSKTLELMSKYDYISKGETGISKKKVPVKTLQKEVKAYGTLYGTGMPYEEYKQAMGQTWVDATEYDKKPVNITVDITKTMNYDNYVSTLKKLSRYEGVYIYKIGKSTEGRDLYAIEIDMASNKDKDVFMLTGQIHAREFAGGTFIVKEFVDLVQKAQTDKKTMELLKSNKFVAIPIINVDGREALITAQNKWSTGGGQLLKAYTNGTDGGRNFPGLQWGQVTYGSSLKRIIEKKPSYANFPGAYAGSNSETKAVMKWMYHYVVVEQATYYLDLHQQGSIIYAGKSWQTKQQEQNSKDLRTNVLSVINKGITSRKYTRVYEGTSYGMQGQGSSLTDYAVTLAIGAKFSPAYGFSAFTDGKKEYMLMQIRDLDKKTIKVRESNKNFAALTLEIGYGEKYLGNSSSTRRLLANEYNYFNFGKLLEALPKMVK